MPGSEFPAACAGDADVIGGGQRDCPGLNALCYGQERGVHEPYWAELAVHVLLLAGPSLPVAPHDPNLIIWKG